MSWLTGLVKALNPCIHMWDNVETLKDNPEHPNFIVIVQTCGVCGEMRQLEVKGPPLPPPPHNCKEQGHQWVDQDKIRLVANIAAAKLDVKGYKIVQRCAHCGDFRTILQGVAPKDYPKWGMPYPDGYTPPPEPENPPPCQHKWKTLQRVSVFDGNAKQPNAMPSAYDYEQECERCGELRVKRLK